MKKKSRFISRPNPQKRKNRATTRQSSSRHSSATLPKSQAGTDANREDLWVAEKTSLSRQEDLVAWSPRMVVPTDARLLELADIALGLRKPEPFRRRKSGFLSKNR